MRLKMECSAFTNVLIRCSVDGEGYQADVDKEQILHFSRMQVHIFERGTGKFVRKWRYHDDRPESINLWRYASRNKIAVSSEMDALFAITPEGVVEFSKDGIQKQLILKTGLHKSNHLGSPIYVCDILLLPRIGLIIRDDNDDLWHIQ